MYGSGGKKKEEAYEGYHAEYEEGNAPAYVDIPSTEEVEAKKQASQYTDSLTAEEKDSKVKEGLKMAALLVLGLLGLGVMLIYLDFVLVPLVFSRFLLYIFQPFINVLVGKKAFPLCKVRLRMPRWVAVITVLLMLIILFAAFGFIVSKTISDIIDNADYYKSRLNELTERIIEFAEGYGYTREEVQNMIPQIDLGSYAVTAFSYLANILTQACPLIPDLTILSLPGLRDGAPDEPSSRRVMVVLQMVLVLLIVVYMLLGYDGSNKSQLRSAIDVRIRKYILIHSMISLATGVGTSVVLFAFGVDLVLFSGLMAFVLNYIPNIGSALGVLLPLPFVVFKPEFHLWELFAVAAALILVQFLLGQVLEPKILGNAMDIPPITVICALLFWGSLWGIIGAILSVPLTVSIQLYLDNMDHPAGKALAGMIIGDFKMFDSSKPREEQKDESEAKADLELGVLSDDHADASIAAAHPVEEYNRPGPYQQQQYGASYEGRDYRGKADADYSYGYGGGREEYGRGGGGAGDDYSYGGYGGGREEQYGRGGGGGGDYDRYDNRQQSDQRQARKNRA